MKNLYIVVMIIIHTNHSILVIEVKIKNVYVLIN
jgi:hypothetical protein